MDNSNIIALYPANRETRPATSHPPPERMWHPAVYFGGRMNGCRKCKDWRNAIGFYGFDDMLNGVDDEVPVTHDTKIEFRDFIYSGPFAIDTASGHATGHADDPGNRGRVWDLDRHQIARCDLFIAYIEDLEAYGTLVEVGYAAALGKPIALGFSDELAEDEFEELWFARMAAWKVYYGSPQQFWAQVRADWLMPCGRSA